MKYVTCIKNVDLTKELTVNKIYEIISESNIGFKIKNDLDFNASYTKERFREGIKYVKCVDITRSTYLTLDKIYEVTCVGCDGYSIINDEGKTTNYFAYRFIDVDEIEESKNETTYKIWELLRDLDSFKEGDTFSSINEESVVVRIRFCSSTFVYDNSGCSISYNNLRHLDFKKVEPKKDLKFYCPNCGDCNEIKLNENDTITQDKINCTYCNKALAVTYDKTEETLAVIINKDNKTKKRLWPRTTTTDRIVF